MAFSPLQVDGLAGLPVPEGWSLLCMRLGCGSLPDVPSPLMVNWISSFVCLLYLHEK